MVRISKLYLLPIWISVFGSLSCEFYCTPSRLCLSTGRLWIPNSLFIRFWLKCNYALTLCHAVLSLSLFVFWHFYTSRSSVAREVVLWISEVMTVLLCALWSLLFLITAYYDNSFSWLLNANIIRGFFCRGRILKSGALEDAVSVSIKRSGRSACDS